MPLIIQVGGDALVILDSDSVQRLSTRDPLVVDVARIAATTRRPIARVIVTFGDQEDTAEVARLVRAGRARDAIEYACRGWVDRPEDSMPTIRLRPGEGPVS